MRLVKCKNGHVYDTDKLGSCSYCPGIVRRLENEPDVFGKDQAEIATEIAPGKGTEDPDMRIRKNVGILVKTKGKRTGQAYLLYEGTNRIGRADNLEVSLPEEDTVSRNGHAEIVYQNDSFLLFAVKEGRDVFLNEKRIDRQAELHDRDRVGIGDCDFVFIKFDDIYEEKRK